MLTMSFMKLVRPSELRACDIPLVETPFFAADKARRLVEEHDHVRSNMHSLFRHQYRGRGNIAETVHRAVKDGELMLVCEGWDGPFSPLVAWRPDNSLPAGGRWRVNDSWIYTSSAIESAVAQLNECGVTPDQLRHHHPRGVGGLRANMFSANYRQWQRREQADRKSTRLNSSHVKISYAVFCLKKK